MRCSPFMLVALSCKSVVAAALPSKTEVAASSGFRWFGIWLRTRSIGSWMRMRAIHQTKTKLIFGFAVRPIGSAPIGGFDYDQVGLKGILGKSGVPLLPIGSAQFNPLM